MPNVAGTYTLFIKHFLIGVKKYKMDRTAALTMI